MSAKLSPLLLGVLILTACQPVPAAQPISTPEIWQVAASPSLGFLGTEMNQCMQSLPQYAIEFREIPAPSLLTQSADVFLRWGAPADFDQPAYELGSDHLVFLVHSENPLKKLDLIRLQAIFAGEYQTWAEACPDCLDPPEGEIQLWTYSTGEDIQNLFESTILGEARISSSAFLAASPLDVLAAVGDAPTAIGYIPAAWLGDNSRLPLEITDLSESALSLPYLAILPRQAEGDLQAWLFCLSQSIP